MMFHNFLNPFSMFQSCIWNLNATQSSQTVHEHFHTIPTHLGLQLDSTHTLRSTVVLYIVKFSTESCSTLLVTGIMHTETTESYTF